MHIVLDNRKINIKKANNFFKKLIGFMGKKNITYGILFPKTNSIHTFFMKDNIDVIALNNQNEVILHAVNVPKNKIIAVNNSLKNTNILELPKNTSNNIKIGDYITFIEQ